MRELFYFERWGFVLFVGWHATKLKGRWYREGGGFQWGRLGVQWG